MKIIVLGAGGQLGRGLCAHLPGDVVGLSRNEADLTQPAQIRAAFEQHRPDVVVNAAAFTHVDRAETESILAMAVNGEALNALAELCREFNCTLIHFSTNYVFGADDRRGTPYVETDAPGPLNFYGESKLRGEQIVQRTWPRHFILRTCGLYGTTINARGNFVDMMLRRAEMGLPLRVVCDQVCTPTSVYDLVGALTQLLRSEAYGLYHVTNAGECSWHEFAQAIVELTDLPTVVKPITSDQLETSARRPQYSVLSNAHWIAAGFTPLRPWCESLAEYLAERSA